MTETDHPLCMLLSKLLEELRIQTSILRDTCKTVFVPPACTSSASSSAQQLDFASTVVRNAQELRHASFVPSATPAPTATLPAMSAWCPSVPFAVPLFNANALLSTLGISPSPYLLIESLPLEVSQILLQQWKENTKTIAEIKNVLQRLGREFHKFQCSAILNNYMRNQQLNQSHRIFNQFLPRRRGFCMCARSQAANCAGENAFPLEFAVTAPLCAC